MSKVVHGIYLLAGGNLGNPPETFRHAREMLNPLVRVSSVSSLYITPPWKMDSKNMFYNQVWQVETGLSPRQLLELILKVEEELGRIRGKSSVYEDRTLDIDILLFGDQCIAENDILVPHKHLHQRAFALLPLLELNPDLESPVSLRPYKECLNDLGEESKMIKKLE